MPRTVRVDSQPLIAGRCVVSAYAGHGILGRDIPTSGINGPPILYPGLNLPAENDDEFRILVLTRPASLPDLVIGEDSSLDSGATSPPGTHLGTWRGYKNGQVYGPDPSTYTIVIGSGGTIGGTVDLGGPSVSGGMGVAGPTQLGGTVDLGGPSVGGGLGSGGPIRPPAETGYYPRLRRTVRLAVADPQEVPDLSPVAPGDTITLEFDFRPWVAVAAPTVTVARIGGDDGLPGLQLVGQAVVVQGSYVLQRFNADLTALHSVYQVACQVTTDDTGRVTATGRLPVRIC